MAWQTEDNINLTQFSTMRIGGVGKTLITAHNPGQDLEKIFQELISDRDTFHVVAEGSNSIFADSFFDWYFLKLTNNEIDIIEENDDAVRVRVGAGCIWDDLVVWSVEHNLSGIEMLSAIPGTVGAASVQNIGAYGGEFSNACLAVDVFDTQEKKYKTLSKEDCRFGYRTSMFKENAGRYIIYSLVLELAKQTISTVPDYPGVAEYLKEKNIIKPALGDIRNAITDIRWGKLPRPEILANCGSFFKNTYTTPEQYEEILKNYPDCVAFPQQDGSIKIPTGWLIDSLGLKQHRVGDIGLYEKHALIIVNHGDGSFTQLQQFITDIQEKVFDAFGIQIIPEVNIITPYENT